MYCIKVVCLYVFERIFLDHLESPDEAVRVVQAGKSIEGAKMVAK